MAFVMTLLAEQGVSHERDCTREDLSPILTKNNAAPAHCFPHQRLVRGMKLDHHVSVALLLQFHGTGMNINQEIKSHPGERVCHPQWVVKLCVCELATQSQPFEPLPLSQPLNRILCQ